MRMAIQESEIISDSISADCAEAPDVEWERSWPCLRDFRHNLRKQGFTLVELAIVLLIAGILLAAIWSVGEVVHDNYQASHAAQQIVKIVQNIREYYVNAQQLPAAANNQDITAILDGNSLFPLEMRRNPAGGPGGPIDNPFNNALAGGSFHIVVPTNCPNIGLWNVQYSCFTVQIEGLEPSACIKLLQALPVNDADLGAVGVMTQFGAFNQLATAPSDTPAPVTADTARSWCNQAGNANEVDFEFRFRN